MQPKWHCSLLLSPLLLGFAGCSAQEGLAAGEVQPRESPLLTALLRGDADAQFASDPNSRVQHFLAPFSDPQTLLQDPRYNPEGKTLEGPELSALVDLAARLEYERSRGAEDLLELRLEIASQRVEAGDFVKAGDPAPEGSGRHLEFMSHPEHGPIRIQLRPEDHRQLELFRELASARQEMAEAEVRSFFEDLPRRGPDPSVASAALTSTPEPELAPDSLP